MVNCVGANSRKTELCPSAASKAQALQKAPSPRLLWLTAVIWGEGGRVVSAPPVLCQRRKEVLVHSYEFCPLLSYCFFSQKGHGVKLISLLLFPQGCRSCGICLSQWGAAAWFTAWQRMSVRADLTRKKKKCVSFLRRSTAGLNVASVSSWHLLPRDCSACAVLSARHANAPCGGSKHRAAAEDFAFVGSILACIPLAPAAWHTGAQGGKCSYILFQFSGKGLYHTNLFCFGGKW